MQTSDTFLLTSGSRVTFVFGVRTSSPNCTWEAVLESFSQGSWSPVATLVTAGTALKLETRIAVRPSLPNDDLRIKITLSGTAPAAHFDIFACTLAIDHPFSIPSAPIVATRLDALGWPYAAQLANLITDVKELNVTLLEEIAAGRTDFNLEEQKTTVCGFWNWHVHPCSRSDQLPDNLCPNKDKTLICNILDIHVCGKKKHKNRPPPTTEDNFAMARNSRLLALKLRIDEASVPTGPMSAIASEVGLTETELRDLVNAWNAVADVAAVPLLELYDA